MLSILGSIVTIIGGIYDSSVNEDKNHHFDNEDDIHMSSKNYEANGYGHDDLNLPTVGFISYDK